MDTTFSKEGMLELIETLEARLCVPADSIYSLGTEDDWSFVIKTHALVEGAVSVMLATCLDERLRTVFERLPLGDKDFGKAVFAKTLGLLTQDQVRFISQLSTLRNLLAHDPRSLNFTFET